MSIGDRIKLRRNELGITQEALAKQVGKSQSAVGNWESNQNKPSRKMVKELAEKLSIAAEWLEFGESDRKAPPIQTDLFGKSGKTDVFDKIPILGGVDGSHEFGIITDPVRAFGRIERPPVLREVKDAYAVYIVGSEMEPRYFAGDLVYINPNKPLTANCFAVVRLNHEFTGNKPHYTIMQFLEKSIESYVFWQYNPPNKISMAKKDLASVHRIVGCIET